MYEYGMPLSTSVTHAVDGMLFGAGVAYPHSTMLSSFAGSLLIAISVLS